ncbi:MAG: pyridoxal-phosphate dependent enzyme, partial [Candidatus Kariarchaeaceae archaeon]
VFVPERASQSKVSQLVTLGATVVRVQGGEYSEGDPSVQLFRAAVKEWGWTPCPSFGPFNPFQFEGTKSLGYEIIEQLNWEVPDWILCNTGSGGLLSGTAEGFFDWEELGWIDALPKFVVVQPNACDPIVQSFNQKLKPFEFRDKEGFPDTVAGGLADPHPWDGDSALDVLYRTNGAGVSVSDAEIMEGQTRLASREGIFGSPTGVAAIAALIKMVNDGQIDSSDTIVIPVTDHGLKDPNVLESRYKEAILCSANILELQDKLPK